MNKRRGFTLLELIVVIIILGILATIGFAQYSKMIEKGRMAEANSMLGTVRTMAEAYKLENGAYPGTFAACGLDELSATSTTRYFSYAINTAGATATRLTAGGKPPVYATAYTVSINFANGTIANNL